MSHLYLLNYVLFYEHYYQLLIYLNELFDIEMGSKLPFNYLHILESSLYSNASQQKQTKQKCWTDGKIRSGYRRGRKATGWIYNVNSAVIEGEKVHLLSEILQKFSQSICIFQTHVLHGPVIRIIKDTLWSFLVNKCSISQPITFSESLRHNQHVECIISHEISLKLTLWLFGILKSSCLLFFFLDWCIPFMEHIYNQLCVKLHDIYHHFHLVDEQIWVVMHYTRGSFIL